MDRWFSGVAHIETFLRDDIYMANAFLCAHSPHMGVGISAYVEHITHTHTHTYLFYKIQSTWWGNKVHFNSEFMHRAMKLAI